MRSFSALAGAISLCAASLCAGCVFGHSPSASAPTAAISPSSLAPLAPAPRPDGRLPVTAIPTRYHLALHIDPSKPRFAGQVAIDVDVPAATRCIVLNARDMNIAHVEAVVDVRNAPSARVVPATATSRAAFGSRRSEELVLTFAQELPAGEAQLRIDYDAPFAVDLAGLYTVEEQGRSYAYTQFEATDARRAFPCFDEPGFKTPYDITVTSPKGLRVLANTPEATPSTESPSASANVNEPDGSVLHTFQPSPPLPSYLVALAVGDFDVVEGQKKPFPIRVVTTKGRGPLASTALGVAAALVAKLSEYFDIPYPYAKLDLVAVPDFAAGAMENPGLVTFRDALLLLDPAHATTGVRRSQAEVIAHEFAHQWFGDLVTLRWWDDLWLNEGFATWAEGRMVDAWKPSFGATAEQIAGLESVMDTDAQESARRVREPVRSTDDAEEAFDGITYDKGAAVLRMLESWLGPVTFRRGVQRYLRANAWKNAGADDLFGALDYVSAHKVAELAGPFVDQTGVPDVHASWSCTGPDAGKISLRPSEWRPLGEPPRDTPRHWTVPVCLTVDGQKTQSCLTLGSDPLVRSLGGRCPSWIYPNADLAGYYRFDLDPAQLSSLAASRASLDATDRLGLLSNTWASVRQGSLGPGPLLDVLSSFDTDKDRFVVDEIISVLKGVDHALIADSARPAFRQYVAARLLARKRSLGWEPAKGTTEDDDRALMRHSVLWTLADLARDETTLGESDAFAAQWLKDPTSVQSDTAATAVPLASIQAGAARLLELRVAAKNAKTPEDRVIALRAMGMFDDETVLRQAWDLALTDEVKLSELRYLFFGTRGRDHAARAFFAWEKDNWTKLHTRVAGSLGDRLADVIGAMCTQDDLDVARTFFAPRIADIAGAKRPFDEAVEASQLCVALRQASEAKVTSWLSAQRGR